MAVAGPMESAVMRSARIAAVPDTDEAGVLLARRLARAIDKHPDDPDILKDLAPKLIDILTKLALTAAGRGVVRSGKGTGEVKNNDKPSGGAVLQLLTSQYGPGSRAN